MREGNFVIFEVIMNIGEYIRFSRLSKKLRQSDLSEKSNVNSAKISRLEKYNQMISFDEACKICEALGITPNELWGNIRMEYLEGEPFTEETGEEGRARGSPGPGH